MMNPYKFNLLYLSSFLFISLISISLISAAEENDPIFLNCGENTKTSDQYGREWITDIGSPFLPPTTDNSVTSIAKTQDPSVPQIPFMTVRIFRSEFTQIPFMTVRIFRSEFTYSFPVTSGRKLVRLYFHPSSYANFEEGNAVFDLTFGPYTLLRNFSPSRTAKALNFAYIVKEFYVNVIDGMLNLTFKPSSSSFFAFVNGIELVSSPNVYNDVDQGVKVVGFETSFVIDNTTVLENVYRLNVGGNDISSVNDSGLFRSWSNDSPYIFGAALGVTSTIDPDITIEYPKSVPDYVAPKDVYSTARTMGPDWQINLRYNLTWIFPIDSGFLYLVRLHFCEIEPVINMVNQRAFKIFINNQTAEDEADVIIWTRGNGIPLYRDYIVLLPQGSGQQDMWLALHPNTATKSQYYDAILNGVEVFKVNDSTGNLAVQNAIPALKHEVMDLTYVTKGSGLGNSKNHVGIISGGVVGGIAAVGLLSFIAFLVSRHRMHGKNYTNINEQLEV